MRVPFIVVLGAFFLLGLASSAFSFPNEPDGFRGLLWTVAFTSAKEDMSLIEDDGEEKFYIRSGEKLSIGAAKLVTIKYGFYKGQLSHVLIKSEAGSMSDMIETFHAQFGGGIKKDYQDFYVWKGALTTIALDCNQISTQCTAVLESVGMGAYIAADKANAAASAKGDF